LPKTFADAAPAAAAVLLTAALAACAPKRFVAPADAGVPVEGFAATWQTIAAPCLGVSSMTAELALSGRAGGTRLRGRVQSGFARGSMRLEGVAPFGQPVFILASTASRATLLLPRDERVVTANDAAEILDALAGVRLRADSLMAVLAGCAIAAAPVSATAHGDLTRFAFPDGAVFVRARPHGRGGTAGPGTSRIVAADLRPFLVEYLEFSDIATRPRRMRLSRDLDQAQRVDLTISASQIERNVVLPAEAFTVDVPPGTAPMTLAELRAAGPLGAKD